MPVYAKLLQLDMVTPVGADAVFNIFYGIVDTVALTAGAFEAGEVAVPMASPGTWKDSFIQAVINDAAARGYTLLASNLRWESDEPGDYRNPIQAINWTKDITKTNLAASFVNVYLGNAGEGQLVDFSGYKQYRLVVQVNKVGTGTQDAGIMDVTNALSVVSIADAAAAGEHTLDSGWTDVPAWMSGEVIVKPVARSTNTADDPIYRQFALYLR